LFEANTFKEIKTMTNDDTIHIGTGHLGMAAKFNYGAGIKFLPNRAAANGKATAIMIESYGDGTYTEVGYNSTQTVPHEIPLFDTREEAIEYAAKRWICN